MKQKSRLQVELELFLDNLSIPKTLANASPEDVRKFLVFKDGHGKTQVHVLSCAHVEKRGQYNCGCPMRASAGSVDGFIGKPRAIFCDSGCGSEGNPILGLGNPAASVHLKRYLKTIRLEQSLTAVTPKQAKPVFSDKLSLMSRHISFRLKNPKNSLVQKYLYKTDLTFLTYLLLQEMELEI